MESRYDTIMVSYDFERVYKSGRYAVGPGKSIDAFPQTWQTLRTISGKWTCVISNALI